MKTRPYFVTQTDLLPTEGLERACDLLSGRIAKADDAGNQKLFFKLAGTLHRFVRCLLGIAWSNYYLILRERALATPRSRAELMDRLGGAHALLRWRRKDVWNKGRLAAIADGTYRPQGAQPWDPSVPRRETPAPRPKPTQRSSRAPKSVRDFQLPPQRDLLRAPRNPIIFTGERAAPQPRRGLVVVWPHELDGQYVPNFKSRASHPQTGYAGFNQAAGTAGYTLPPSPGKARESPYA